MLVVNSGNANAFTGRKGRESTAVTGKAAAAAAGCSPGEVFLASTGVIGEPLDAGRFAHLLAGMAKDARPGLWREAAKAIMTTDTYPKLATVTVKLGDADVTINGIAKGAGMIAPDMATMLSFIATDAPIAAPVLQALLSAGVGKTLQRRHRRQRHLDQRHAASSSPPVRPRSAARRRSRTGRIRGSQPSSAALNKVLKSLALQVVRDGEGARKEVEVTVTGAKSARSAKKIALSIANSPLVKTAVAGEDANWGRVVMAVGKAGEPADRDRLSIWFGDNRLAFEGERDPDYSEAAHLGLHEGRRDRASAPISGSAAARPRCGPATSPRSMSRSTATTGADWQSACVPTEELATVRRFEAAGFRAWPAAPSTMTAPG